MATTSGNGSKSNDPPKGVEKIVCDPKHFKIEAVKEEDYEMYVAFMFEHFLPREELAQGLNLTAKEYGKMFRKQIKSWVSSGVSVCATYMPTNELAGIMLTQILTRNEKETFGKEDTDHYSESVQNAMAVLAHLERSVNLFEDPQIDKVLEIAATAVRPKFAGNRLTYRITEESERLAVELGCQMATTQSTNIITQHIRTKMGYKVCYTLDYADFELDGKKIINVGAMKNGTTVAKVMKKYLKKQ